MTRALRHWAALAALPALLAAASPPAGPDAATGRVATVTRLVKLFLEKEASLGAAVRDADAAALGRLVADDFELRAGARSASPVPRAEWLRELLRTRDPGGEIGGMAVHDLGAVAVASFVQEGARGRIFIVDVWRGHGSDWKLAVRYASPAGTPDFPIPGVGPAEPEIPKKY